MSLEAPVSPAVPMDQDDEPGIQALMHWLDLGPSSRSNPVLRYALDEFLAPCGVSAAWLEFELTTVRFTSAPVKLHGAVFDPKLIGAGLKGEFRKVFGPLRENPSYYRAHVSIFAHATFTVDQAAAKGDLHAAEIARDLAYSVERAPAMIRQAFGYMNKFLIGLADAFAGVSPNDRAIQAMFSRRDYTAVYAALLKAAPGDNASGA